MVVLNNKGKKVIITLVDRRMETAIRIVLMPNSQPLCTGAKSNLRYISLSEVEKNSFIALPGIGGHNKIEPSKTVSQPRRI